MQGKEGENWLANSTGRGLLRSYCLQQGKKRELDNGGKEQAAKGKKADVKGKGRGRAHLEKKI